MSNNYKKILGRMFIIESLGKVIYDKLSAKTTDPEFKAVYKILAENESNTRNHIKQKTLATNARIKNKLA